MLKKRAGSQFKKDMKLMVKQRKNLGELQKVMFSIVNEIPLPSANNEHFLHGNYNKCLECHITPDWVLIYKVDKIQKKVVFLRTGSHSDLL